jgi:hypothetical protein
MMLLYQLFLTLKLACSMPIGIRFILLVMRATIMDLILSYLRVFDAI